MKGKEGVIRFATIGTGRIVEQFLEEMQGIPGLEYAVCYSRTQEKAEEFAARHHAREAMSDFDAFARSDCFDAAYIASPNALHYPQAMELLHDGKHVLCEKPMVATLEEAKRLFAAADDAGLVLMEGMRLAYDPALGVIIDALKDLGRIRLASFRVCKYSSRYDAYRKGRIENAFDPSLSNGSLMDMGVYCVYPLVRLFGMPNDVSAEAVFLDNGVDGAGQALLSYDDGMVASMVHSKITTDGNESVIQGEEGRLQIDFIANPRRIDLIERNGQSRELFLRYEVSNMRYEIQRWEGRIRNGETEAPENSFTLMEMGLLERIRKMAGIRFPEDSRE